MNDGFKVAICTIGNEEFAVPISEVKEIVTMDKLFSIPDVPNYITGMINLRGAVYVIYDLRVRFNITDYSKDEPKILIMNSKKVGLVVDEVSEIITITKENIDSKNDYEDLNMRNFVLNIIKLDSRVIINLDVKNLLNETDSKMIGDILDR